MHYQHYISLALAAIPQLCLSAPDRGKWEDLSPIIVAPRQEHTTTAISSNIVGIFGGIVPNANRSGWDTTTLVQLYDIAHDTWRTVSPLPLPLNHPNVATVNGKAYVLGGLVATDDGAWRAVPDSWVYDPETDSWETLTPIPDDLERGSATMGVYGTTIFLAGGMRTLVPGEGGEQDTVDVVTAYDTESAAWTPLPETARRLPEGRDHAGGAVVGQMFYVLGGRNKGQVNVKDTVFELNLEDLKAGWATADARMPTARGGIAAASIGTLVYTFGGEGNPAAGSEGVFNNTEVYDTEDGTWKRLGPMPLPRHGTSAVAVGKGVFIPGGGIYQGGNAVDAFDVFYPQVSC